MYCIIADMFFQLICMTFQVFSVHHRFHYTYPWVLVWLYTPPLIPGSLRSSLTRSIQFNTYKLIVNIVLIEFGYLLLNS